MGRPRKYANDAEKAKAFRIRHAIKTFATEPETAETIERLAKESDESESVTINSLIKFALLNRNWFRDGLITYRKQRTK